MREREKKKKKEKVIRTWSIVRVREFSDLGSSGHCLRVSFVLNNPIEMQYHCPSSLPSLLDCT